MLLLAEPVKRIRVLRLLGILVHHCYGELCEVAPPWQKLIVVRHAQKQRKVIAHVASLRVHQNVPLVAPDFENVTPQLPFADLRKILNLPSEFSVKISWNRACTFFDVPWAHSIVRLQGAFSGAPLRSLRAVGCHGEDPVRLRRRTGGLAMRAHPRSSAEAPIGSGKFNDLACFKPKRVPGFEVLCRRRNPSACAKNLTRSKGTLKRIPVFDLCTYTRAIQNAQVHQNTLICCQ
mmetsp:Transcript_29884/g.65312  ORF Transcript_29884/g.65312 Transcript_29884/m.65312 type:complete len:234 (+) Transcript_29884:876-1577(+)